MKTVLKYGAAVALTGALALTAVTPSQAGGYGSGYYDRGYAPGYAYRGYAYAPRPAYGPPPGYYYRSRGVYRGCGVSPASFRARDCS